MTLDNSTNHEEQIRFLDRGTKKDFLARGGVIGRFDLVDGEKRIVASLEVPNAGTPSIGSKERKAWLESSPDGCDSVITPVDTVDQLAAAMSKVLSVTREEANVAVGTLPGNVF